MSLFNDDNSPGPVWQGKNSALHQRRADDSFKRVRTGRLRH